jgi:hypothetical protein
LLSLLDKRLRRNVGKKASTCYLAFAVATVFSLDNSFNGINVLAWTALLFVSNFLWYLILVTLSRWGGQWEEKHTCSWLEWSNWRRKYWEYAFSWNGFEGACFLEGLCYSLLVFQPYASILCLFLSFNMMHNKHCFSFSPLPSLLTVIFELFKVSGFAKCFCVLILYVLCHFQGWGCYCACTGPTAASKRS